jgi:predicted MFS family arabinose efflux permease
MASFYIFARQYSAAVFATLAGAVVGIGSLGNIAASLPLAWAADLWGWRGTSIALAVATVAVALALFAFIQDPEKVERNEANKGSLLDILKMPAIWLVLPMALVNYAPAAGLRGTWAGPYFSQVHGLDAAGIGQVTLFMGLAMIVGNLSYGPMDRLFGTRKWVVLVGNTAAASCLLGLAFLPGSTLVSAALLFALAGLFGSSFPMIMAHGRAFIPPHLAGRGVTLLNLFGIGGAGLIQFASGPLFRSFRASAGSPEQAYQTLFLTFAVFVLVGCAIYLFSKDRTD